MTTEPEDPRAHHQRREQESAAQEAVWNRRVTVLAWGRLVALIVAAAAGYQACEGRGGGLPLMVAAAAALALSIVIAAFARRLAVLAGARRYAQQGLARVDGRWADVGTAGAAFQPDEHPFAADLDLFGRHSLFALLCVARTANGQRVLASWLLQGADVQEVRARQAAVDELRRRPDLRERLWRVAGEVTTDRQPDALVAWLRGTARPPSTTLRLVQLGVGVAGALAGVAALTGRVLPLLLALPLLVMTAKRSQELVRQLSQAAYHRTAELAAMAALADVVQGERFRAPWLVDIQARLNSQGERASRRIGQLVRLVRWFESRRNPFFAVLTAPALVVSQLAGAIERWRAQHGQAAAGWLQALGELEALASVATYAFEHPSLPHADLTDDADGPRFEAQDLAHPLLPVAVRIGNDVTLNGQSQLWLVTGSNMSGKSTLLRAVGANAVLAQAGAPVTATRLRMSRLSLGATLRTSDSLEAGVSRFYAEIKRLRGIVASAAASPFTLFLLDEILYGTNAQDRAIGAEGILRALVGHGAIGMATTHDLSLAEVAASLAPAARNVHFEDAIEDGVIRFDYQLRPGVVPRGNAVALMRMIGLPV